MPFFSFQMLKDLLFVIKPISIPLYINKLDLKVNRYDDINSGTTKAQFECQPPYQKINMVFSFRTDEF